MNISLIGLGAIGASYAEKLNECESANLSIILDENRYKTYFNSEFTINGKVQHFNYVKDTDPAVPADLVIIAVKYNELQNAIHLVRNHVGENTTIMSLLNGIDSEEIIGATYGAEKLLFSMCLGIDAQRTNKEVSYGSIGKIVFGEKDSHISTRVETISRLFEKANVPYENPADMYKQMWWKFMINVCSNQPTAILGANYHFLNTDNGHRIMHLVMTEVSAIAKVKGVIITEDDFNAWIKLLGTMVPENKTSMLQDMDAGRATEVDMFSGVICKIGDEHRIETPYNDLMYHMIKLKEQIVKG